uniref:BHLH domain-containing protein n=1 Tax=Haplochromis burtoni TaxID=8153 RepID=A0A3Q2X367_HAPBU
YFIFFKHPPPETCVLQVGDSVKKFCYNNKVKQTSEDAICRVYQKPLMEKLRRERINTCIEQLKSLLVPEFLKQQPDSNLEKADILEMTVCSLTQLQQQRNLLTESPAQPKASCRISNIRS